MNVRDLLGVLGQSVVETGAELAAGELVAEHGPKLRVLLAVAQLRKLDAFTLRLLAARIEAQGAEPGDETRARSAAAELVNALADWADA